MDDAINLSEFDDDEELLEERGTAFASFLKPSLAQAFLHAQAAMASCVSETEKRIIQKFVRDAMISLGIDRNMLRHPKRLAATLRRQSESQACALSTVSEIFNDPTDRQIMEFSMAYVGTSHDNPLEVAVDTIQRDLGLRCCLFDCPRPFYLFAGIPEKKFRERMAADMPLQRSGLLFVEHSGEILLHHKVKSFLQTGATGDPWAFLAADQRGGNLFQEIAAEEFIAAVDGLGPLLPALQRGQHVRLALQHTPEQKGLNEDLLCNLARCVGAQLYWVDQTEITLATQILTRRSGKSILGVIPGHGRRRRTRYDYIEHDDEWDGSLNHGPSIVWLCEDLPKGLNHQIDGILRLNRKTEAGRSILTNALRAGGLTLSDGEAASLQQIGHLLQPSDLRRAAARVALQQENCETEAKLKLELSRLAKVRGIPLPDNDLAMDLDAALVSVEGFDFEALLAALSRPEGGLSPTLLFSGPPGSGKSMAAHLVAQRMKRPVLLKRISELLGMYVGQTERQIAAAFAEADSAGAVLVLDEADSLLFPRQAAMRSWEVSATNTMLVELEARRVPVVCTTNLFERLDVAALRRFDVKLTFGFLRPDQARMAFERFFGCVAPEGISVLQMLTPGDFRTVKARADLLSIRGPDELLRLLRNECEIKPGYESGRRIGFCA
jgi:hypothetical protein